MSGRKCASYTYISDKCLIIFSKTFEMATKWQQLQKTFRINSYFFNPCISFLPVFQKLYKLIYTLVLYIELYYIWFFGEWWRLGFMSSSLGKYCPIFFTFNGQHKSLNFFHRTLTYYYMTRCKVLFSPLATNLNRVYVCDSHVL